MFKKFFKYTLFLTLLIGSLFLCGYGYSKLSNKLEAIERDRLISAKFYDLIFCK